MILLALLAVTSQWIVHLDARPSLPDRVYDDDCSPLAYTEYQNDFGKKSDSRDEERRNRLCGVIDDSEANNKLNKGFTMGLNALSDLSDDEYTIRQGFAYPNKQAIGKEPENEQSGDSAKQSLDFPESFDWRDKGFISTVRDQGNCSSSWAFTATGAIEFAKFTKNRKAVKLSEQNLIDCSKNIGCKGGNPAVAMRYIADKGVDSEQIYPYEGKTDLCSYREYDGEEKINDFNFLPKGDELALKAAVATIGPVAVGIDASLDSFKNYQSGIYFDKECSRIKLTQAVLVIGYGSDVSFGDYWIVKNSWGDSWGENGYAKIARNRGNVCGIATSAVYPIV